MLIGWRRQQFSRRLGRSLIDGRERTVWRFQVFADGWPWSWRAEALERLGDRQRLDTFDGAELSGARSGIGAYVTDPRYGRAEREQRVGARRSQICHRDDTAPPRRGL